MTSTAATRRRFLAAAGALPLLYACAPVRDPNAPADLAILPVATSHKLSLMIDKHPDAMGSIERALMFQGDIELGVNRLTAAMNDEPTGGAAFLKSVSAALQARLVESLGSRGMRVITVADPRVDRVELLSGYPTLNAAADRIVDIIPRAVGYWSEYPDRIYFPWIRLEYRVFDRRAGKIAVHSTIGTGPAPSDGTFVAVPSDQAFSFATFEDLVANPARAAAGIRASIPRVADALAAKL